mmetsp:Transcript_29693/g.54447  ORF Transcript_29693/g.54447 Transcript_29693/m.54447 type:complete len:229 (-) Transcript_29693:335-1021(-)
MKRRKSKSGGRDIRIASPRRRRRRRSGQYRSLILEHQIQIFLNEQVLLALEKGLHRRHCRFVGFVSSSSSSLGGILPPATSSLIPSGGFVRTPAASTSAPSTPTLVLGLGPPGIHTIPSHVRLHLVPVPFQFPLGQIPTVPPRDRVGLPPSLGNELGQFHEGDLAVILAMGTTLGATSLGVPLVWEDEATVFGRTGGGVWIYVGEARGRVHFFLVLLVIILVVVVVVA